jgi:hypothetical protein
VVAQKDAADERRMKEQAHVPNATSDPVEKPDDNENDREEGEAGDAEHSVAEDQAKRRSTKRSTRPRTTSMAVPAAIVA